MGSNVIQLHRHAAKPHAATDLVSKSFPRSRRITVTLAGPLLAQVEAAAERASVSVQDLMRVGVGELLDRHDERVQAANKRRVVLLNVLT